MPLPLVEILLPTYNGSLYIDELVYSLLDQSYPSWSLLVRDDASRDGTYELLLLWRDRLPPGAICIVDEGPSRPRLGSAQSFGRLLSLSAAPYVMMCDQDDVWLPFKIEKTLNALWELESQHVVATPCLVCSDVSVTDSRLSIQMISFWKAQSLHPARFPWFGRYLLENTAQGCTLAMNRPLVELSRDVPPQSLYADWWIALVASAFGVIRPLPVATMLWRRHGSNLSHTSNVVAEALRVLVEPLLARHRLHAIYCQSLPQAQAFSNRFGFMLSRRDRAALDVFVEIGQMGFFRKRFLMARHGILFTSIRRCAGLFLFF